MRSAKAFAGLSDNKLQLVKGALKKHEMFTSQRLLCDAINYFVVLDGQVITPEGVLFKVGKSEV
tara:strand:- start:290 stop:481 length:192 start_codon:yes stop_codon:yes gene_type:complete